MASSKSYSKLEAIGLYVSGKNLQGKNEFVSSLDEEPGNYYSQYFQNCKEEAKKIKEENKPLYNFLRENNGDSLVSIWERNEDSLVSKLERSEDVCSKFYDKESLRAQYPEYADILINKANQVEKEIFLRNHKPLIDALPQLGYYGSGVPGKVRAFLEENRDRFETNLGNPKRSLIDFTNFKDTMTLHVPRLELCASVSEVIKNNTPNVNLNNPNAEQLHTPVRTRS